MHKLIGILIEGCGGPPLRRGRPCAALKKGLGHAICAWAYGQTIRHREGRSPLRRERQRQPSDKCTGNDRNYERDPHTLPRRPCPQAIMDFFCLNRKSAQLILSGLIFNDRCTQSKSESEMESHMSSSLYHNRTLNFYDAIAFMMLSVSVSVSASVSVLVSLVVLVCVSVSLEVACHILITA